MLQYQTRNQHPKSTTTATTQTESGLNSTLQNANDLVTPICICCYNNTPDQELLTNCGHLVCKTCLNRKTFKACPICRSNNLQHTTVHVSTLMLAWKNDASSSYNTTRNQIEAPAETTNRPGDISDSHYDQQYAQQLQDEENRRMQSLFQKFHISTYSQP